MHLGRKKRGHKDFWALRDIDLDIAEGETVGLLGHNGSGKSTLLKCVGGILSPTEGEIRVRGRIASLLELGAGFHPDLTGRENVFLNASILGMAKRDIEQRLDEIVAFAELEAFIDEQVKHYSSGMYVRLGFAVAINVEPDVLLVDEVLSVGDEAFQQKCLDRVRGFQQDGRTIIFVSHAADLVRRICDRVMVLDHGRTGHRRRPHRGHPRVPREAPRRAPRRGPRARARPPHHPHHPHRGGRGPLARAPTTAAPSTPARPCRWRCATSATSPPTTWPSPCRSATAPTSSSTAATPTCSDSRSTASRARAG